MNKELANQQKNKMDVISRITGLIIFLIALLTYLLTMEPTNSWWDCGEYIATAYKLQVGHPPGAPLFLLIANLFSQFAGNNVEQVAWMINFMSVLFSAGTIFLLFCTTKRIADKMLSAENKASGLAVLVAAVGSLAYTFSDSFWFSAVEGEVYAMSSFFTALVFWAIIKWEAEANTNPRADRWLIFIAFLIGLSIGVHMLSLLVIPAIVLIYYFKKFSFNWMGFIIANITSVFLLGLIYQFIIPQFVNLAGKFEIFFVNDLSLPFNSGTIVFFIITISTIVALLIISKKHQLYYVNTATLAFTFLLIGYMSFFTLIIRSNANTPIDENNPEDAVSLLSYLNREQYGFSPLLHGQYFNTEVIEYEDGNPVFVPKYSITEITKEGEAIHEKNLGLFYKDHIIEYLDSIGNPKKDTVFDGNKNVKKIVSYKFKDKYVISDDRKSSIPVYDPKTSGIFPRMWSKDERHVEAYKEWSNLKSVTRKPTFFQNLRFFFSYQIQHMYVRYFMWNFAGKQNDQQGHGELNNGNWISGIHFVDEARLGPQKSLPEHLKNNNGRNTYYFLPLLLGLLGFGYQAQKDPKNAWSIFLLFFFTGLAIVIELNQTPYQPRERDYAYVGSFYAFSIWIGIGALAIYDLLQNLFKNRTLSISACFLTFGIPFLMASEGWDDHDRSDRYTARDFAENYLKSCEPNAILFTMGDNDTFPLWYVQEVEGFRTDVRIVNLSLLNTDWYIDQMKRAAYDGDTVPFSLHRDQYKQGTRDVAIFIDDGRSDRRLELSDFNRWIRSDDKRTKINYGKDYDFFFTKKIRIPVAKDNIQVESGDSILDYLDIDLNTIQLEKKDLMILDLIENNNWERPIYFAITIGSSPRSFLYLNNYFQLDGMVYKLTPIDYTQTKDGNIGGVNTEILYPILMNDYEWGNLNGDIYLDETNLRMTMNFRNNFSRLAEQLIIENKTDSAKNVLDYAMSLMPGDKVPLNYFIHPIIQSYYAIEDQKANSLVNDLSVIYGDELKYYLSFPTDKIMGVYIEILKNLQFYNELLEIAILNNHPKTHEMQQEFQEYFRLYKLAFSI